MMPVYGSSAPDAELIILFGNCQTPYVAALLAQPGVLRENIGILCVLNHAPEGEDVFYPDRELLDRCVFYLEQHDGRAEVPVREFLRQNLPDNCPRLVFPSFALSLLWPFSIPEPRKNPVPTFPWGVYPYGNLIALQIANRGLRGAEAVTAYMEITTSKMPDFDVALNREAQLHEYRDNASDIRIGDYVLSNFRRRNLFCTSMHVSAEAIGELASRIFNALDRRLRGDHETCHAILQAAIAASPSMDQLEEPIHPAIAETLGLEFHRKDMKYKWYDQLWTHDEYMERYIAYDVDWLPGTQPITQAG